MKVIGMIGGMSWESSLEYYRLLNEGVKQRLGGFSSARMLMFSVDFAPLEDHMMAGRWDLVEAELIDAARRLETGGADFFLIATNTMHNVAPEVEASVRIPLLHIGDPVGREAGKMGLSKVGLLGTRFTMEKDFLRNYLARKFGLEVIVPGDDDRVMVHDVIFDELCQGRILDESRRKYIEVIGRLKEAGAQGVILGCTEIPMLVRPEDVDLPLLDTTALHARAALETALKDE